MKNFLPLLLFIELALSALAMPVDDKKLASELWEKIINETGSEIEEVNATRTYCLNHYVVDNELLDHDEYEFNAIFNTTVICENILKNLWKEARNSFMELVGTWFRDWDTSENRKAANGRMKCVRYGRAVEQVIDKYFAIEVFNSLAYTEVQKEVERQRFFQTWEYFMRDVRRCYEIKMTKGSKVV